MSLELSRLVAGMGRPRIAVVGDAIVDEYVWGEVERISPEAPIPVLNVRPDGTRGGLRGPIVLKPRQQDVRIRRMLRDEVAAQAGQSIVLTRKLTAVLGRAIEIHAAVTGTP